MFISHSRLSHKLCRRVMALSLSIRSSTLKQRSQTRGQTTIEYVLLIAMVAGVASAFKVFLFPPLIDNLEKVMGEAGGRGSQGGTSNFGSYYSNSQTFKK